jgi:hypothetical protein
MLALQSLVFVMGEDYSIGDDLMRIAVAAAEIMDLDGDVGGELAVGFASLW